MPKVSKFFRVAVEGQTLLPSVYLTRDDIENMATDYDLSVYTARNNLEHWVSLSPSSDFKMYGKVLAVKTEEIKTGALAGKLALLAQVEVTDELQQIQSKKQKLTTSIEYIRKFPATGRTYLTGLAFTDSPASMGTEEVKLSLVERPITMSYGLETELSIDEPNLLTTLKAKITGLTNRTDTNSDHLTEAVNLIEQLTDHSAALSSELTTLSSKYDVLSKQVAETAPLKQEVENLTTELTDLKTKLSMTDDTQKRPPVTGGNSAQLTDC